MRRFVHSFWTQPCKDNPDKLLKYLTYFATSCAYIKKHGLPIVLHTDSYGKESFKDIPYDEIYDTLDNIPSDINPKFYAYGKFLAMRNEELGCVHIDGDVFIENKELAENILNFKGDLITQCIEEGRVILRFYRKWDFDECKDIINKYIDIDNSIKAYNCGVVGINNPELKKTYIEGYLKMVEELKDYNFDSPFAIPDLVCELMYLYSLNPDSELVLKTNIFQEMKNLGYTHIMGPNKMSDEIIERINNKLKLL